MRPIEMDKITALVSQFWPQGLDTKEMTRAILWEGVYARECDVANALARWRDKQAMRQAA